MSDKPLIEQIRQRAYNDNAKTLKHMGHWDGLEWRLVRINRDVRTKMGHAFFKGQIAMARQESDGTITAYSISNRCDTGLPAKTIEWI